LLAGALAAALLLPRSVLIRWFTASTSALDRAVGWYRLPLPLGVLLLIGNRTLLRQRNLYDTGPAPGMESAAAPQDASVRTVDGSYNDVSDPAMGRAGVRFGRNVPLRYTVPEPEPALLSPNPRTVSRELLTRHIFQPAESLCLLAAPWLQFIIRDWFSHGKSPTENPGTTELAPDDLWHQRPMTIPRTPPDPTRAPGDTRPPTYLNSETHWWDASQIYGSTEVFHRMVRAGNEGKLVVTPDGRIPVELLERSLMEPGSWLGLTLLQALFAMEHNAICDRLREDYPSWSDDQLFQRARLINAALLAKIHTVEWTPAIISHPTTRYAMRGNWWGLAGERLYRRFGRLSRSEVISGIPGSPTDHHAAPYAITEEFAAVYRMHPLVPDDYTFRSMADGRVLQERTFRDISGRHVKELLEQISMNDLLYSFGHANPGAVVLHNFPRFLQEYERPDGVVVDLAATDILRTREQGVPRYNQFRRLFHLKPARSFEALTANPEWAEEMRRVYGDDIERVDLSVGMFAERLPLGFGFSDTAFRVFVLMASRRLKSDRFFTRDFTPEVYTPAGFQWINDNTMASVLLRHFPDLEPALRGVSNAFMPWTRVA